MLNISRLKRVGPYAVILALAVFLYDRALEFDYERVPGRIGPDAWPRLLLGLLMAICVMAIFRLAFGRAVNEARGAHAPEAVAGEDDGLQLSAESHPGLAWAGIALTFVYLCAFEWVGFFLASVVYLFLLMYIGGFRRPIATLSISVITALAFVFVFMKIVYVSLPLGRGPFLELSVLVMNTVGIH